MAEGFAIAHDDAISLHRDGFTIARAVLAPEEVARLVGACEVLPIGRAGVRSLIALVPAIGAMATSSTIRRLIEPILGPTAFVTRSILFDKTPATNWDVVWHQDTTIAVEEQREVDGFGPWSVKLGIRHVQPPASVLERMVTLRLHLDYCSEDNGPLFVVPGSHARGIIPEREIDAAACDMFRRICTCAAGDAILMRPLLLHASRKAIRAARRRVIHLEFAAADLPGGLRWARA